MADSASLTKVEENGDAPALPSNEAEQATAPTLNGNDGEWTTIPYDPDEHSFRRIVRNFTPSYVNLFGMEF